jgi:hypothetical protein
MHDDVNINIVDDFSITGDVFMSFNHRDVSRFSTPNLALRTDRRNQNESTTR